MTPEQNTLHLSFDEAEEVAADLVRVWTGLTGLSDAPGLLAAADLVQRTLRKARAVIAMRDADPHQPPARMHIPENELPY